MYHGREYTNAPDCYYTLVLLCCGYDTFYTMEFKPLPMSSVNLFAELVAQFLVGDRLKCIPGPYVLWLWHLLYNVGQHIMSSFYLYLWLDPRYYCTIYSICACCVWHWWGTVSQSGDADSSRVHGLASGFQELMGINRGTLVCDIAPMAIYL